MPPFQLTLFLQFNSVLAAIYCPSANWASCWWEIYRAYCSLDSEIARSFSNPYITKCQSVLNCIFLFWRAAMLKPIIYLSKISSKSKKSMKISSVFACLKLLSDLTVTGQDDGACCSHSASHHLSHDWYGGRVPSLSGLGAVGCTERERGAAAALARPPRRPNLLTQGGRLESQLRRCCFVFCWYVWWF